MKFDYLLGSSAAARNAHLLLIVANVGLVLLLLLTVVTMSKRENSVRMLPPFPVTEELRVSQTSANVAYYETWAWWTAMMVGNVNNENINDTLALLSRHMTDQLQDQMRGDLRQSVETMRIQGFRLNFNPSRVFHHAPNQTTYVVGQLTETPVRGEPVTLRFTYEMRYDIRFGMPRLSYFRAYEGDPEMRR